VPTPDIRGAIELLAAEAFRVVFKPAIFARRLGASLNDALAASEAATTSRRVCGLRPRLLGDIPSRMLRSRIIQQTPDRDDTLARGQLKFVGSATVERPTIGSRRIHQIRRSDMMLRVNGYLNGAIGIYRELTAADVIWRQREILMGVDDTP
jgi:hypothetical protein